MAARRHLSYKIRLFKGGRRTAQNRLRYADTFEIWYGKRRVVPRTPFLASMKRVVARRDHLEDLVKRIEAKRQTLLLRRRVKAQAKRKRAREKFARDEATKEVSRRARSEPKKLREKVRHEEDEELLVESGSLMRAEYPDFSESYTEEPQTLKNATIEDVTIIPIKPVGDVYRKRLIEKIITSPLYPRLVLSIMDFTLMSNYIIPVTIDTFMDSYRRAIASMLPHILQYFSETKDSSEAYILRLKFVWSPEAHIGKEYESEHGLSLHRIQIGSRDRMQSLFTTTFRRLLGNRDEATKRVLTRNYLADQTMIYLTGFTLEATSYG